MSLNQRSVYIFHPESSDTNYTWIKSSFNDLKKGLVFSLENTPDIFLKADSDPFIQNGQLVIKCTFSDNPFVFPHKKVFLGGTCAESTWREQLKPLLQIDWFDPVVPDWTPECMAEEIYQRQTCDYVLYVITREMQGVYSIAEVVDDSNKRPNQTIFAVLEDGFSPSQLKSLRQVGEMVKRNGAKYCSSLQEVADILNK